MDIVERLRVCAKFDPDQADAILEIERLRRIINNLLDDGDETDRAEARAALGEWKSFEDRWDNA